MDMLQKLRVLSASTIMVRHLTIVYFYWIYSIFYSEKLIDSDSSACVIDVVSSVPSSSSALI